MTGVLLMAHGAASSAADVPAYLKDIFGARPVDASLVAQVQERYEAIGGYSPLIAITRLQALCLEAVFIARGAKCRVAFGMRHSAPRISEALRSLRAAGATRVLAFPLTPYFSSLSTGAYMAAYGKAVQETGGPIETVAAGSWCDEPKLISAFAARVTAAWTQFPEAERSRAAVIFSAHSLPERVRAEGDPYPRQFAETAAKVAEAAGLAAWELAYQSRGRTAEPWLGPDVSEAIDRAALAGKSGVLVAPIGFISDHMETLYDDDILYKGQAEAKGLAFRRAASLNAAPDFIEALAGVAAKRLGLPCAA